MSVAETSIPPVEPRRFRVERRLNVTPSQAALARVGGVLAALVVAAVVLAAHRTEPAEPAVEGGRRDVRGACRDWRSWACSSPRSS